MLEKQGLMLLYTRVRAETEALCKPLIIEDYGIQAMIDVSPPKWHLAHTTWFFETFLLLPLVRSYHSYDLKYQQLFNSYYLKLGSPFPRAHRGHLSRPSVQTIYDYRLAVNECVLEYIQQANEEQYLALYPIVELGLHHEQQHQELLLMDIKYNFSIHPDFPVYHTNHNSSSHPRLPQIQYLQVSGGITELGYEGTDFCFDNELPKHHYFLQPYAIANRLVTNGEYLEFIESGGYKAPAYWLADGWEFVIKEKWQAPLYWHQEGENWYIFTLSGLKKLDYLEPVSHLSYYEADAFARWQNKRLPTEAEWEHFVRQNPHALCESHFANQCLFHPEQTKRSVEPAQFYGDLWEWTSTQYGPFPRYKPLQGLLGEYNGKFMSNQMVLKGGACVTPSDHIRISYRNFFQPEKRWQFSGIRLATDGDE